MLDGLQKESFENVVQDASGAICSRTLLEDSERVADDLLANGLEKDQCVILAVTGTRFDVVYFLGIWRAGGVPVPVHILSKPETWGHVISSSRAKLLLSKTPVSNLELDQLSGEIWSTDHTDTLRLKEAALVVFTSGTTGHPKGIIQGQKGYLAKLQKLQKLLPTKRKPKTLMFLQTSFSFGQWTTFLTIGSGGLVRLEPRFSVDSFLERTSTEQWDWVPVVPSMLRILLNAIDSGTQWLPPKVTQLLVGGETLSREIGTRTRALWPQTGICDIYGLTETNSADFMLSAADYDQHPGTIGCPTPGVQYRINHQALDGEATSSGELEVKTPHIMLGYIDEQGKVKDVDRSGYYPTGDIASEDESGCVIIEGRLKQIINSGGRKVSPLEIERVIERCPGVSGCIVCSVPSDLLGEKVGALVESHSQGTSMSECLEFASSQLESYKVPQLILLVEKLPALPNGKIDRKTASKMLAEASTNT